jgi:hypothetical protein
VSGSADAAVDTRINLTLNQVWLPLAGCTTYWGHFDAAAVVGKADAVADAKVNGSFHQAWHASTTVVEPTFYDDWISVAGLPVKLTVTMPIDAGIDADAKIDVNASTHIGAHGNFAIACTSDGCDGLKSATLDFGQNQTPQIGLNVRAHVSPWAQASVKLSLYDGLAAGQVGARATLASDFWAYYGNTCGDADGDGVSELVQAATLDAKVLVDLRASASFFGLSQDWSWNLVTSHVGFWTLGSATALDPIFYASRAPSGAVTMRGRMRPCWPYTDSMHYTIDWNDGSAQSAFDAAPATLLSAPHSFPVNHTYAVTLTAVGDAAGRGVHHAATRSVTSSPVIIFE